MSGKTSGSASNPRLLSWLEAEVYACRRTALRYFRSKTLVVKRKGDQSPVTVADRILEERLRKAILKRFPGDRILGEEFGDSGAPGDSYWTIDPIDGTRAFTRGIPTWAVMVGRVVRGRPVMAVCDFPALDISMAAVDRGPAYERVDGRRRPFRRAAPAGPVREAVIFHGASRWFQNTPYEPGFRRLVGDCFLERAFGDCYGYLWLFRSRVDAVVEYGVKPWDIVPLAAIAAATGRATVDFSNRSHFLGPETVIAHPAFASRVCGYLNGNRGK